VCKEKQELRNKSRLPLEIMRISDSNTTCNLLRPERSSLSVPQGGLAVCNTHRVTASFPSLKATLAVQEKGWKKVQKKCQGPVAQAAPPLAALSLPGVHAEGLTFLRLAGKEASPHRPDAEFSVGTDTGKKDFAEALMVGGLLQACPKYCIGTAQAKGIIYPHPHFPPCLINWGKHSLCL